MKIVAVLSSANSDGLTASLAEAALRGAKKVDARTELIHLNHLEIEACRVCDSGWGHHRDEDSSLGPDE